MRTFLFLATAVFCAAQTPLPYVTPTPMDRLAWATLATAGPASVAGGAITSAYSTWTNSPPEYGPHWDGWGKRQALRMAGASTSNFMEAGLGAFWGEDPRYRRSGTGAFKGRTWYVVKSAFLAFDREGHTMPAYARYASVTGSNILGNTWRPDSQRTAYETTSRIYLGFLSRMASNAFLEFWPDVRSHIGKKH